MHCLHGTAFFSTLALLGCGGPAPHEEPPPADAGMGDAHVETDSGVVPRDGGPRDAGANDAGRDAGPALPLSDYCATIPFEDGLGELDRDADGVLTAADVDPGEAIIQIAWTAADGTRWLSRHRSDAARAAHDDNPGGDSRWAIWFRVDCPLAASAFVWFAGPPEALRPGDHATLAHAYDVPEREQLGDTYDVGGVIVIDAAEPGVATGHLRDASGELELLDLLDERAVVARLSIQALAFRAIPADH